MSIFDFDITDTDFLAYMDSEGALGISDEQIERIVRILRKSPNEMIENDELFRACRKAGIVPAALTQADVDRINELL